MTEARDKASVDCGCASGGYGASMNILQRLHQIEAVLGRSCTQVGMSTLLRTDFAIFRNYGKSKID